MNQNLHAQWNLGKCLRTAFTFLLVALISTGTLFAAGSSIAPKSKSVKNAPPLAVTVKGTVKDKDGLPIPGVNVKIKGAKMGTVTNENGTYSLELPTGKETIVFSYIGFKTEEAEVNNRTVIDIVLTAEANDLNEVVVVGYGTQKRTHLTGAIATVDMKNVMDMPVGNLSEALKGQINGVSVSGGYQRPGEVATITIRNPLYMSKDGGSKDPLFVIDDIQRTKSDFDLLDASEIESLSVLKDAAAAIYGILGSNGVVIIKTKRGKAGTSQISYSASFGLSDAPQMPKMMTGYQQAVYLNDNNAGSKNWDQVATEALPAYYTPDELEYFKEKDYNWLKQAWQKSYEMRHTLNITGGSDRATYFAGFTYNENNSNFEGLGYKRYSFRASSDIKLTAGLTLGLSLSANLSDKKNTFNKQGNESLDNDWKTLVGESPFNPPYIAGLPIYIPGTNTNSNINNYHYFAVHELGNYTSSKTTGVNFQGQLAYEFPFLKGLKASVNYNKNINNFWGKQYGTKYNVYQFNMLGTHSHIFDNTYNTVYTFSNGDRVRLNPSYTNTYQLNAMVTYNKQFGKHEIGLLYGYEQSESYTDITTGMVEGVVVGGLPNMSFATGAQTTSESETEAGRSAYVGRIDYNYASKYLLQLQFRADASQNFAPENRWGYFPSGSVGWVVSEEGFFKGIKNAVNYLKFRGSIGFMGLDATKNYQWLRSYTIQVGKAAVFGGNSDRGLAVGTNVELANRDVHWDNVDKYNAGLDAKFMNNRLTATVDAFLDKRTNMLANLTSSPSILIGAAMPTENFGKQNNFGYEVSLGWRDHIGSDWGYNVTANFNWMDNKILVTDVAKLNLGTYLDPTGKSSDQGFMGYRCLGMFRSQAEVDAWLAQYPTYTLFGQVPKPGMLYFEDVRGPQNTTTGEYAAPDGIITSIDQDYLTKKSDNHYGLGINWGVSYKTLSLNVVMGMSWGGIGSVESTARSLGSSYSNRPAFWADHWTPTNMTAAYPSPYYTGTYNLASDFWWRSSYSFRVTNFNLSYTLPKNWMNKIGMSNARIYFTGTNPVNFFNPYDYKDNANGSYESFPQLTSYSLGLNINL